MQGVLGGLKHPLLAPGLLLFFYLFFCFVFDLFFFFFFFAFCFVCLFVVVFCVCVFCVFFFFLWGGGGGVLACLSDRLVMYEDSQDTPTPCLGNWLNFFSSFFKQMSENTPPSDLFRGWCGIAYGLHPIVKQLPWKNSAMPLCGGFRVGCGRTSCDLIG